MLVGELSTLSDSLDNSKKRNHLYRCFVFGEHRTLGRRVRIRIPECVIEFIRSICPDPNNNYTGHRDIDEDGTELQVGNSRNNESFKSVLPDSILGEVDFEGGEKVKICVSFDDNTHPIQKVREFVNKSPAQGWTVTFSGENYTNATMICNSAGIWREVFIYCMMSSEMYTQVVYDKV